MMMYLHLQQAAGKNAAVHQHRKVITVDLAGNFIPINQEKERFGSDVHTSDVTFGLIRNASDFHVKVRSSCRA
jgi:hypothetical protein